MSTKCKSDARIFLSTAAAILCFLVAAAVTIAHREPPGVSSAPAPQGQPPVLSKEYVYAGARLIATEQPCSYVLSAACGAFAASGTEASFTVTTAAPCGWTAVSNASWITISSQSSGMGNAIIGFVVRDNVTGAARQGAISIAGCTFSVVQTGSSSCTYSISPSSTTLGPGGGAGALNVSAAAGCAWQAVSSESWITISSGGCGSGSGAVAYSVAANVTGATRFGTITVNGRVFAIKQTGV